MAALTTPEYVTKSEIDLRMGFSDQKTEILISSMKEVLDERLEKMQAVIEKNLAKHEAIASDMRAEINGMRAEISDIRGDIKALAAQVNTTQSKMGWYITLLGVGVSLALGLFQLLIK